MHPVQRLVDRMRALRTHLGPFKRDDGRLEHFLQVLPTDVLHVVEFRDPSWSADEVSALLDAHNVARGLHDMKGSTTGHVYFDKDVGGRAARNATSLRRSVEERL